MDGQASKILIVTTNLGKHSFSGVKNPCLLFGGSNGLCSERKWVREPLHGIFPFEVPLQHTSSSKLTGRHLCAHLHRGTRDERMRLTHISWLLFPGKPWIMIWWQMLVQMDISLVFGFLQGILSWYWPVQKVQSKIPFAISPLCPRELRRKTSVTKIR